jgi:hypothetical protein
MLLKLRVIKGMENAKAVTKSITEGCAKSIAKMVWLKQTSLEVLKSVASIRVIIKLSFENSSDFRLRTFLIT